MKIHPGDMLAWVPDRIQEYFGHDRKETEEIVIFLGHMGVKTHAPYAVFTNTQGFEWWDYHVFHDLYIKSTYSECE